MQNEAENAQPDELMVGIQPERLRSKANKWHQKHFKRIALQLAIVTFMQISQHIGFRSPACNFEFLR